LNQLNVDNCLQLLNQSYEKLKDSENTSNAWYLLFNQSLNVSSKYLRELLSRNSPALYNINKKILGEMIQRFLKSSLNFSLIDEKFYELVLFSRDNHELYQLLEEERKSLLCDRSMFGIDFFLEF